ncbi:hypothetical protein [Hydrogenivirga sp. 128-5-R1-1]|uniref:hypothetical protein n=1 Tax=Hydrogenivirga sp. 128-5-R1-1 TaxID=392423 RepID=UPI00015EFF0C|nr:hypothetical protein [Hydrogenivirga sp. 128-5-R1-1]EDP73497.1 hypothetical protein HG1285_09301 [Hydrogenivirga sp. 128-5-R1-1]
MPVLSEIEPQTEQHSWTDFKVFIIEENSGRYAKQLKKDLNNPKNQDLIHEIDKNFNLEDLKIYKKDKIIFVITNFKENWQKNAVRKIINKSRENKSKILLITLNNPPLEFEKEVYTFKAKDENQLLKIPALLIGSVYIPGLICIDPNDIYQFLFKNDYGKIDYFSYDTYPDSLNQFKNLINENISKPIKSIFIHIEISYENQFEDVENIVSIMKETLNPENII